MFVLPTHHLMLHMFTGINDMFKSILLRLQENKISSKFTHIINKLPMLELIDAMSDNPRLGLRGFHQSFSYDEDVEQDRKMLLINANLVALCMEWMSLLRKHGVQRTHFHRWVSVIERKSGFSQIQQQRGIFIAAALIDGWNMEDSDSNIVITFHPQQSLSDH